MSRRNRQEQQRLLDYRRLSAREQLAYWTSLRGLSLEAPPPEQLAYLTPLLERAGDWRACSEDRPYEDRFGLLTYMVYAPAYGGELLACSFHRGRWASNRIGFIGGVTHWRVARPDEEERLARLDELPVTVTLTFRPERTPPWH